MTVRGQIALHPAAGAQTSADAQRSTHVYRRVVAQVDSVHNHVRVGSTVSDYGRQWRIFVLGDRAVDQDFLSRGKKTPAPTVIAEAIVENDSVDLVPVCGGVETRYDDDVASHGHATVVVDQVGPERRPESPQLKIMPLGIVPERVL